MEAQLQQGRLEFGRSGCNSYDIASYILITIVSVGIEAQATREAPWRTLARFRL
jgi:hypothetical protein